MKQSTKASRKPSTRARKSSVRHKKSTNRKSTAAKRNVSPLALHHHVKRAYHATPKFVHGMVVGGVFGLLVVGFLGGSFAHPSFTNALTAPTGGSGTGGSNSNCDAHGIGDKTLTHSTDNTAYTIHGNKTTVTFNVVGKDCNLPVTMVVWKAPNGTSGQPYSEQTLFYHISGTFHSGQHQLTGTLPACYFQVDTVTGTKLTGSTGQAYNYDKRQVAFMHGGDKSCNPPTKPPKHISVCDLISHEIVTIEAADFDSGYMSKNLADCTVTVTPPTTTPTPQPVESASTTLPNTGPGEVLVVFALALAGGYLFHVTHHHRQHRKAHASHGARHKK